MFQKQNCALKRPPVIRARGTTCIKDVYKRQGLQNSRVTTNNPFSNYSPDFQSVFKATLTQHLLQGAGIWMNKRFIYQAQNNRKITDSSFRQQILYTVNQVETIYWGLVQAYELSLIHISSI